MSSVNLVSITPNAEGQIIRIARVSSNQDNTDLGLLRFLIREGHWSPFEMANAVVEFNTSRAIAQQILRHRSFSFQEFSQRYAAATNVIPYPARRQAEKNRQSSIDDLDEETREWWENERDRLTGEAQFLYHEAIERGVAKECARFILPLATETRLYVNGTIRSWIHYFDKRCDEHTQLEHRQLAEMARSQLSFHLPTIAEALGW